MCGSTYQRHCLRRADSQDPTMTRIWIIEDNRTFRRVTRRGLELLDSDLTVDEFDNCEDAVASLALQELPDVVLMDIGLPGMDGITGIKQIKGQAPDTSILVLTVFEDDDKILRAVQAGASGYCLKSDSLDKVAESVRVVLAGGGALPPRVAERVLKMLADRGAVGHDYGLSDRELAVLEAMTRGLVRKQIASELQLNTHTLDYVTRCLYRKLGVNGVAAAVALAVRERLVEQPPGSGACES